MWEELLKSGATGAPQIVEWAAIAAGIVVATVIGRLNLFRGRADKTTQPQVMAEIAGAVIDKQTAELIVDAARDNSAVIEANTRAVRELARRIDANTEASKASATQIAEARVDIRDLTHELIRSKQ
jgi:hypothetical protein